MVILTAPLGIGKRKYRRIYFQHPCPWQLFKIESKTKLGCNNMIHFVPRSKQCPQLWRSGSKYRIGNYSVFVLRSIIHTNSVESKKFWTAGLKVLMCFGKNVNMCFSTKCINTQSLVLSIDSHIYLNYGYRIILLIGVWNKWFHERINFIYYYVCGLL